MAREKLLYTYVSARVLETVLEAIINLCHSDSYESCIRNVFRFLTRVPYEFSSVKTQDTLPEVIIHLCYSDGYESCIRNIFRYICDSDTIGAISGAIAAALHPDELRNICKTLHPDDNEYKT